VPLGVSPQKKADKAQAAKRRQQSPLLSPLRGSHIHLDSFPWADAHGYVLSPLRG